jgi:hypothetical protein
MATLQETFDRLSGISLVRERLADVKVQVEEHRKLLLDHERRLLAIEVGSRGLVPRALPKK